MSMMQEFKKFAVRGNVVDMAVGIVVGGAFATIAKSLVSDVIMPPIGLLLGGVDFSNLFVVLRQGTELGPYATLVEAQSAGAVVISYGVFGNNVLSFIIVALAAFFLVKGVNSLKEKPEAVPAPVNTKECPHCCSSIPLKAVKCPQCTTALD